MKYSLSIFFEPPSLSFLSVFPSSGLSNLFPVRLRLLILCLRRDRIWSDSFYRKIEDNIHSSRSLLIDLLTVENLPFPCSVGYAMGRVSPRLSSWDIQTYSIRRTFFSSLEKRIWRDLALAMNYFYRPSEKRNEMTWLKKEEGMLLPLNSETFLLLK